MSMAKRKSGNGVRFELIGPPEQQLEHFEIGDVIDRSPGGRQVEIRKAYRRKPMIDILRTAGVLSHDQWKALRHYRHHADIADRSLIRDSLSLQRGGNGDGPTITTIHAISVTRDCEAAAGSLADILRAVVIYDQSLSQWAISQAGGIEECYVRKGRKVCQIKPRCRALQVAKLEIVMAAARVQAELDA